MLLLNKNLSAVNIFNLLLEYGIFWINVLFGASDPVKFMMRPDYTEPEHPPSIVEKIKKGDYKCSTAELIRDLDIYSGIFDGFSYRSYHRLLISRERGFYKDIGPKEMYRGSITGSMEYGWFLKDPALKDKTWFKSDSYFPRPWSDDTKFLNNALMQDKTIIL